MLYACAVNDGVSPTATADAHLRRGGEGESSGVLLRVCGGGADGREGGGGVTRRADGRGLRRCRVGVQ